MYVEVFSGLLFSDIVIQPVCHRFPPVYRRLPRNRRHEHKAINCEIILLSGPNADGLWVL